MSASAFVSQNTLCSLAYNDVMKHTCVMSEASETCDDAAHPELAEAAGAPKCTVPIQIQYCIV